MTQAPSGWATLDEALDAEASAASVAPGTGRLAAALILLRELFDDVADGAKADGPSDLEILYTRRLEHLTHHPGQISFPGGRVELAETVEQTALREAAEEVALRPETARILGHLPAFYIPPSGFWLHPVVGRWHDPHPLVAASAEVGEIIRVRVSTLLDPARWRGLDLPVGWTLAWQLDERHVLWGATGIATAALLDRLAPGWRGDARPEELPAPDPAPAIVRSAGRGERAGGVG